MLVSGWRGQRPLPFHGLGSRSSFGERGHLPVDTALVTFLLVTVCWAVLMCLEGIWAKRESLEGLLNIS